MTIPTQLTIKLLSDTTFGRGDGVPGLVDVEVQHDPFGLPFYGGRALKGVLVNECADILFALELSKVVQLETWHAAAEKLFGKPGSTYAGSGIIEIGSAQLPRDLQEAVAHSVNTNVLTPQQVLASLTTIRVQTAMDVQTGTPQDETLRSLRLVIRNLTFEARVSFRTAPDENDLALLAACVKALRRLGVGRNRGRGAVQAHLRDAEGNDLTSDLFKPFSQEVAQR